MTKLKNGDLPIKVKKSRIVEISNVSFAEEDERIQLGDRIVAVDNVKIRKGTRLKDAINGFGNTVELVITRTSKSYKSLSGAYKFQQLKFTFLHSIDIHSNKNPF